MPAYSGLFDGVHGSPHALLSSSVAKGNVQTMLARLVARRSYGRAKFRELMLELTGAAAGAAALVTHKRVDHTVDRNDVPNGGLRTIETFTNIDRVTAAADLTNIDAALAQTSQPATYVADASGNGGGGKLGV